MQPARITEIDLLRFAAALAVVLFHFGFAGHAAGVETAMAYPWLAPVFKYGYLGVQLFFMISGFVILMTASGASVQKFAVSRFVRIFPGLWICATLTYVCMSVFADPRFMATPWTYATNLFLLHKLFGFKNLDGAYWSLFYELQFYAFVAAIVALRKVERYPALLWVWLLASLPEAFFPRAGRLSSLLLADTSGCFIAGSVFYLIWAHGASRQRMALLACAWLLTLNQALREIPRLQSVYNAEFSPVMIVCLVSLFFAVMLMVSLRQTGRIGRMSWATLGALTYPLYLLHQNIGFLLINKLYPALSPHLVFWGVVAAMIALAFAVHRWLEKPLMRWVKLRLEAWLARWSGAGLPQAQP